MEGNLSLLLYHGSTVGWPNTSSTALIGSEPGLELPPSSSPLLGIAASLEIGGSPSPKKVFLRLLADFREEKAITGKQGREKEEKENEKEEENMGFDFSECALWFSKSK